MAAPVPPAAVVNTLEDLLLLCEVPNDGLFNGATKPNRITNEVFNDDFNTCMDLGSVYIHLLHIDEGKNLITGGRPSTRLPTHRL